MRVASRAREAIWLSRTPTLSAAGRLAMLAGGLRRSLGRRVGPMRVPMRRAAVHFDGDQQADWGVFREVFATEDYACDYRGSVVIDIGAHRGLFAAYALSHGARAVLCYEPAPSNLSYLERTLAEFAAAGFTCEHRGVAVGARDGESQFFVYQESWAHSVVPRLDRRSVAELTVPTVTIRSVLARAAQVRRPGERLILKIDAEGSEYEILLAASPDDLARVDETYVEVHSHVDNDPRKLLDRLASSGLVRLDDPQLRAGPQPLFHHRRAAPTVRGHA